MAEPEYTLYSYFRSSCSARLRIALNLKSIPYTTIPTNLLKDEHLSPSHRALNPSASVPLLVHHTAAAATDFKVTQSVAALEYLEETHPSSTPLLPGADDPRARAVVRSLVNIVACDVQPVTNLRVMRRVRALGGDAERWNRELTADGFAAYEAVASEWAGAYSVGDHVSLADVCLLPAYWNAERFGVDLSVYPTIAKIVGNLKDHEAVVRAHYFNQPDTPDELKLK
ncbi:Putative glutathione S-transferase, Thioredoxin-like superfamily, glutathione transferase family [Colletotrichum destructivum]|uniref:Glutathione S-transferase, Thioredoxin-like superfamily, glutathione transferase family n=1 Tax=Colletotrichum destructivum TaxID=34406 RepID=A0AAX4I7C5_9PEZI|nr:Putative glutathione S-transferase, Thioredoxin-like superfamily, glutathione transferase family [Colletotrichum destructivum]